MADAQAKLVKAARNGDRAAFDALVRLYERQAVAVTTRMLGNLDDGLEAAQEGFIKAYQALDQLKDDNVFKSWLMRIMVNQALNRRRHRARRPALPLEPIRYDYDDHAGYGADLDSSDPGPVEQLEGKELALALQQAIDELPEKLRVPLILFSVEKMPQKDIAQMLGTSLQTVKWSVFEARRRLRHKLRNIL